MYQKIQITDGKTRCPYCRQTVVCDCKNYLIKFLGDPVFENVYQSMAIFGEYGKWFDWLTDHGAWHFPGAEVSNRTFLERKPIHHYAQFYFGKWRQEEYGLVDINFDYFDDTDIANKCVYISFTIYYEANFVPGRNIVVHLGYVRQYITWNIPILEKFKDNDFES
jgi:hypothetical protein